MKTTWTDYLRSAAAIALIALLALGTVYLLKTWTYRLFGDYRILANLALGLVAYGLWSALALRLMLAWRPVPTGEHAAGSAAFSWWMLLTVVWRLGQGALRPFVPQIMRPVLDQAFGAKVGRDVAFGGSIDDPYLVTIGDESVLGNASLVAANYLSHGRLTIGRVQIGNSVTIGANSIVMPDTRIADGAVVMSGSCVMPGTSIGQGEVWRGNPARPWKTTAAKIEP